jgi:8-amino-7-oxononanoate synthase
MSIKDATYASSVGLMRREKRLRKLKPMIPINGAFIFIEDQKMLSFCSHDYLALADHPEIKKKAIKSLLEHGITASTEAKDLYLGCQQKLEERLAKLLKREAALLFPSRSEANRVTLSTLGHKTATLFLDEGAHPSLHEGAARSQANVKYYPHNRLDLLENLLEETRSPAKILVTESVYSLTGTVSNLPTLIELADHFDALLFVDDSHAFGVAGVEGMGLATHLHEVDLITGSFSKACGAYGGYLACSETLRDFLVNSSRDGAFHLFPPPIMGAIEAAFDLIPQMEGERKQLQQRSHWLRNALRDMGFSLPKANVPLISLLFNSQEEVEKLQQHLQNEQILLGPPHTLYNAQEYPRLNFTLNVCHMPDHLTRLVDTMKTHLESPLNAIAR